LFEIMLLRCLKQHNDEDAMIPELGPVCFFVQFVSLSSLFFKQTGLFRAASKLHKSSAPPRRTGDKMEVTAILLLRLPSKCRAKSARV
jgi:hypothetical protein